MPSLRILTSLGTSHQVSLGFDDGDSILLDWCGSSVTGQRDIPHYNLSHIHILELQISAFNISPFSTLNSIFNILNTSSNVMYIFTLSMWGGQFAPVASTGISSYFSKLIPVLPPEKSSLKKKIYFFYKKKNEGKFINKWVLTLLSEQVLLFQALTGSSGFGPVLILGLICPARVSPTSKTSTLISEHMHIQSEIKTWLWIDRVTLAYSSYSTDLNFVKGIHFSSILTFLLILVHGHWRTVWTYQNVLQSCCRQGPLVVLSSCFLCCRNC